VKEFLSRKRVAFEERNVAEDESALEELEALGVMTTPVTVIDGELVIGFDRRELDRLLSEQGTGDGG